jgi:hypothetical protein
MVGSLVPHFAARLLMERRITSCGLLRIKSAMNFCGLDKRLYRVRISVKMLVL